MEAFIYFRGLLLQVGKTSFHVLTFFYFCGNSLFQRLDLLFQQFFLLLLFAVHELVSCLVVGC